MSPYCVNGVFVFHQSDAEVQEDAVAAGQKVLIIDDLLATGGEKRSDSLCLL